MKDAARFRPQSPWVALGVILGLYWDNGKENWKSQGLYWGYIGMMEKTMETTGALLGLDWDNEKEHGNYRGYIRVISG